MSTHYASGNWRVTAGAAEQFIDRWREFLSWTRDEHDALESATLLRSSAEPDHFVSFAAWTSADARDRWKMSDDFGKRFMACRELCDEFSGGDFDPVVEI